MKRHTIFLLLFLKESINQILSSNKDLCVCVCVCVCVCDIFISILDENTILAGLQNEKSSWSGLNKKLN